MSPEERLGQVLAKLDELHAAQRQAAVTQGSDAERIAKLEDDVQKFEAISAELQVLVESNAEIERDTKERAGEPEDKRHLDVIDREVGKSDTRTDAKIGHSDQRTEIKVQSLRDVVSQIAREISTLQNTTLFVIGIAALILAVLVDIGWRALAG